MRNVQITVVRAGSRSGLDCHSTEASEPHFLWHRVCSPHSHLASFTFPRSPKTNVTVEDINNNTPTVTVVNTQRITATNSNNDQDTNSVTASNSNLITNTNRFGRSGFGNAILETKADTCTSTFTVTNYRGVKRRKFSILI